VRRRDRDEEAEGKRERGKEGRGTCIIRELQHTVIHRICSFKKYLKFLTSAIVLSGHFHFKINNN